MKRKSKKITTTDIWTKFLQKYPTRYSETEKIIDGSVKLLDSQAKNLKANSLEEICFWCNISEFVNMCLANLSDNGSLDRAIQELGLN